MEGLLLLLCNCIYQFLLWGPCCYSNIIIHGNQSSSILVHGSTYRLDAEARCPREHCNPSGPWNVASRAQRGRYPQAPGVQCRARRYRASASNRFRPQNLIGRANSNRQQRTRTTHFNFGSYRRSMALNASLPSRFLLCGGPETVERLLAAANRGFQRSHALCEPSLH